MNYNRLVSLRMTIFGADIAKASPCELKPFKQEHIFKVDGLKVNDFNIGTKLTVKYDSETYEVICTEIDQINNKTVFCNEERNLKMTIVEKH